MSSDEIAIRVENLGKCYQIYDRPQDRLKQSLVPRVRRLVGQPTPNYYREFWALRDVSFEVRKGETVGIIGRNGSGKSTLLQIVCGTLTPTTGTVETSGRVAALLELGAGFNPEFTGRENVLLNAAILGVPRDEMLARMHEVVAFSELSEFLDQPVKTYSSGMFVRLAFAVQAHIDASIVVIDEALAVGDVFFRQKCYARLEELRQSGAAILLVSHSMPDIEQYCERAVLLDHGVQRFMGHAAEAAKHYYLLHQPEREHNSVVQERHKNEPQITLRHSSRPRRSRPETLLDLSDKSQVTNGKARCVAIAICNTAGAFTNNFRQGNTALFYFEFELSDYIGVPICGIVITNDRGVIVHGKNSWQTEDDVPTSLGAGSHVACWQEVELRLAPGEYTFEIGLAAVAEEEWRNRSYISHDAWAALYTTVCVVTQAGHFSISLADRNGVAVLSHHGIADLPNMIVTEVY